MPEPTLRLFQAQLWNACWRGQCALAPLFRPRLQLAESITQSFSQEASRRALPLSEESQMACTPKTNGERYVPGV